MSDRSEAMHTHTLSKKAHYGKVSIDGAGVNVLGDVYFQCQSPATTSMHSGASHASEIRNALLPARHEAPISNASTHIPEPCTDESTHRENLILVAPVSMSPLHEETGMAMSAGRQSPNDRRSSSQSSGVVNSENSRSRNTSGASQIYRRGSGSEWSSSFTCTARKASIWLRDGGPEGRESKDSHTKCRITLEARSANAMDRRQRRLRIEYQESGQRKQGVFWVPLTNAEVSKAESEVVVRFSNCVQKLNTPKNKRNNYKATYSSSTPNVVLYLDCTEEAAAQQLENYLLLLDEPLKTENAESVISSGSISTVWCTREKKISLNDQSSLFLWSNTGSGGRPRRILDFGFFSLKVDFEVEKLKELMYLHIRYLQKVQYIPEDLGNHASWPPAKIKENEDGGPAWTELGDGHSSDDTVSIPTTPTNLLDLLNATIGVAASWKAQGYWQVKAASFKPRSLTGIIGGPTLATGYLTLWKNEDTIRFLIRYNAQSDGARWLSWTLPPGTAVPPQANTTPMLQTDGCDIVFRNVGPQSGAFLSLESDSMLQPPSTFQRRRSSLANPDDATKVKVQFLSKKAKEEFLSLV